MVGETEMDFEPTCSVLWFPVHYHYDKRSKCIIRTIGSLENALILPQISHSISIIIANFDILLGIIVSRLTITVA